MTLVPGENHELESKALGSGEVPAVLPLQMWRAHQGRWCCPTQFFEKYVPYVLGMLHILQQCLKATAIVAPAAGITQPDIEKLAEGKKFATDNTLDAVNIPIAFLESRLGADDVSGAAGDELGDRLMNLDALERADLRRLETFLRNKDKDKVLENLYRITTSEDFLKQLTSQAPAVNELDMALLWELSIADLTRVVEALAQTNLQHVAFKRSKYLGTKTSSLLKGFLASTLRCFYYQCPIQESNQSHLVEIITHHPNIVDLRLRGGY
ncbi:hypothetical protein BGZ51_001276 [Haplosporangium sp. Z 767]|nr:hypothetical protein BGZ51_001276 [Haplosporangium sp. Z 767]KAF9194823.1 hypothetical protein BGZ50_005703 [Haplosporangium sp. Z 11]